MGIEWALSLIDQVTGPAKQMTSALGSVQQQAKTLQSAMTSLEKQATTATAVARAIGELILKGAEMSIEAADLKDKLEATFEGLTGSAAAANQLLISLDGLSKVTGLTRAQLAPMAEELAGLGFSGAELTKQIYALSAAQALGMGGEQTYLDLIKKVNQHLPVQTRALADLYKMGINVADIAKAMGESTAQLEQQLKKGTVNVQAFDAALAGLASGKGSKALEAQALSLTSQLDRFKENISKLFEDVDVSPFLKGLKSVLDLFDTTTNSGKALKAGITAAFNAIFKVAAMVWPWVKKAIEYVIIAALKVYIAFKPVIQAFKDLFKDGTPSIDFLFFFKHALGGIVDMAQVVAGAIMAVIKAVKWVSQEFNSAKDAAKNLIDGLVNGIKNGTGLVMDAIKSLGKGAMDALKGMLGIHSPSREFAKLGMHVGTGFAQGITAANDNAASAATGMGAAVVGGVSAGLSTPMPAPSGGKSKGGTTIAPVFQPGSIVINGAGKDAESITEEMLTLILERVALTQGLATGT